MSLASQYRMSVLHIDRDADLPLLYVYLPEENAFQTLGYVRLRGVTVWGGVSHAGPDTDDQRDRFLLKVLTALLVPPREAQRIVHTADHVSERGSPSAPQPRTGFVVHEPYAGFPRLSAEPGEQGGTHMSVPGVVVGLLGGLFLGWLLAGWNGAVIGAFVGASTFPDLFVGGWQAVHAHSPRNYVESHDTVAILLVAAGTVAGGVLGYVLGSEGFGQARGVFLGMALTAFALALLATTFSMVPFRQRSPVWFGPLVVGALTWAAHSLWSSPAGLALGIIVGTVVAGSLAGRVGGVG
ncbi:hypothetical protein WJ438_39885 [Streptomyces sp. GD-15H]|uniref:hypothetical protein n=1 Tax=Streptomyces sp. GD-15H TaxID=3129112 RepID=UPI003253CCA4